MNDPLARWPELISIQNLALILDVHVDTARKHVMSMSPVNVGTGRRRADWRVSKDTVRERFFPHTIKNLRLVK